MPEPRRYSAALAAATKVSPRCHSASAIKWCGVAGAALKTDMTQLRAMGVYYLTFVLASAPHPPTSTEAPNPFRRMMAAARDTASAVYFGRATSLQV